MSRRKGDEAYGKALDLWQAPPNAGEPLVCIATSYTFDATFFETECIGRFLQMEAHPSESASVAYLIEREEKLAGARVHALIDRRHARDKESLRWDILLRTEMRSEFSETRQSLRQEIAETHRSLRQEIAEKHDEALRYMRVLHEEVIDRLKTMQEGQQPHPPSRFALRRASRPQNDS